MALRLLEVVGRNRSLCIVTTEQQHDYENQDRTEGRFAAFFRRAVDQFGIAGAAVLVEQCARKANCAGSNSNARLVSGLMRQALIHRIGSGRSILSVPRRCMAALSAGVAHGLLRPRCVHGDGLGWHVQPGRCSRPDTLSGAQRCRWALVCIGQGQDRPCSRSDAVALVRGDPAGLRRQSWAPTSRRTRRSSGTAPDVPTARIPWAMTSGTSVRRSTRPTPASLLTCAVWRG